MTSVIVTLVEESPTGSPSKPGRTAATVLSVSQKPVIITKTCKKFFRLSPLNRSFRGDSLPPLCSKTSDSDTERE